MNSDVRGWTTTSATADSEILGRADGWGVDPPELLLDNTVEAVLVVPPGLCAPRAPDDQRTVRQLLGCGSAQRNNIAAYTQAHEAAEALAWKGVDGPYVRRLLDPAGDDRLVELQTSNVLNEPAKTGEGWFVYVPVDCGHHDHRIYGLVGVHLHSWAHGRYGYGGVEAVKLHLDACRREALALARSEAQMLVGWHTGGCHRIAVRRDAKTGAPWFETIYAVNNIAYSRQIGINID